MGKVIDFNEYRKQHSDKVFIDNIDESEIHEYVSYFFEMDAVLRSKFTKRK